MHNILICQAINCPYWSSNHKRSYGCQRYALSEACHLTIAHSSFDARNEYALYTSDASLNLAHIQAENEAFLLEDPKYLQDIRFFELNPDLAQTSFSPRKIDALSPP